MPHEHRPLKVFLCHAHSDKSAVLDLYFRLTRDGIDAWLDKENLLPGQDWEYEIRRAVREADVVVVCLSKQFNQAGFRQKEVRIALDTAMEQPEGEIFIIPARLEDCDTLESLRKWHWVDLFEGDGYEMLMRALRARANKIGAVLHGKRNWLPKVVPVRKSESYISEKIREEEKGPETAQQILETPRKQNTPYRASSMLILGLIGFVGMMIALLSSPLMEKWFPPPLTATITPTSSTREAGVTNIVQTTPTTPAPGEPELEVTAALEVGFGLVYISEQGEERTLYHIDSEGQRKELLTTDDFNHIGNPVLSPQGNQVAIETDQGIYTIDVQTGSLQELSSFGVRPVWRPDGLEMAFETGDVTTESIELCNWESKRYGYGTPYCASTYESSKSNLKIYIIGFSNGSPQNVYNPLTSYYGTTSSAWNKSGSMFALIKREGADYLCAFTYPPGSWEVGFTKNGKCIWTSNHIQEFDWSPLGNQIVFSEQDPESGISNLHLLELSNSSRRSLTEDASSNYSPVWNHAGDRIAFVTDRDGNQEIYVMDVASLTLENVTQSLSNDFSPVWSPDDDKLVFVSDRSGTLDILSIDLNTHQTVNLTDDPGNQFFPVLADIH